MNQIQMTMENIVGAFYQKPMISFVADSADLNVTEFSNDKVSGEIKISSGTKMSLAGKFSAVLCLK